MAYGVSILHERHRANLQIAHGYTNAKIPLEVFIFYFRNNVSPNFRQQRKTCF
jgi:hypothetical protein